MSDNHSELVGRGELVGSFVLVCLIIILSAVLTRYKLDEHEARLDAIEQRLGAADGEGE